MNSARQEPTFRERVANQNITDLRRQVAELRTQIARLVDNEQCLQEMAAPPPADVIALAEQANRAGCLSEEGRQWLARAKAVRQVEQR